MPKGEIRGPYHLPSRRTLARSTRIGYMFRRNMIRGSGGLMIYQDGQAFKDEKGDIRAQNVMDNLIYRRRSR